MKCTDLNLMGQSYVKYLQHKGYVKNTIRQFKEVWRNYEDYCQGNHLAATQVRYADILVWIEQQKQRGNRVSTLNHKLRQIEKVYHYHDLNSPTRGLRLRGQCRGVLAPAIPGPELERLYEEYPAGGMVNKRDKQLLGMVIWQGLRRAELERLQIKDIDLHRATVEVVGARRSEGRVLKLQAQQLLGLQEYILRIRPALARQGRQQGYEQSNKLFLAMGRSTNVLSTLARKVKQCHPRIENLNHIRSSVIRHWLKEKNLREVQYMAGHRYVSSTEYYLEGDLAGLQDLIKVYHPLEQTGAKRKIVE